MPEFLFRSGEGMVLDERAGHPAAHLYVAVTPEINGRVVIVNFTSVDEGTRESWKELTLDVGDHDFIRWPTCIPFAAAKVAKHQALCQFANERGTDTYSQMSIELHQKILTQLVSSRFTPGDVKAFVTLNFGPQLFKILGSCVVAPRC